MAGEEEQAGSWVVREGGTRRREENTLGLFSPHWDQGSPWVLCTFIMTLTCLAVLARRAVQEYIITSIKEVLRTHFNRVVELKVGLHGVEIWTGSLGGLLVLVGAGHLFSSFPLLPPGGHLLFLWITPQPSSSPRKPFWPQMRPGLVHQMCWQSGSKGL